MPELNTNRNTLDNLSLLQLLEVGGFLAYNSILLLKMVSMHSQLREISQVVLYVVKAKQKFICCL